MALKIFWTKRALKNFTSIQEYLEKEFGSSVARSFLIRVLDFIDTLQDFPELGTMQNRDKGIRGFVIVRQCSIYYKIVDDQIRILGFFDNRRDPSKKII